MAILFSCRKKNDPTPAQCYIVNVEDSTVTQPPYVYGDRHFFISYDANGRISTEVIKIGGDTTQVNFAYGNNTIIRTEIMPAYGPIARDSITLNNYGLISDIHVFSLLGSNANTQTTYFDDSSGHLTKSIDTYKNYIGQQYTYTVIYHWENGNMVWDSASDGTVKTYQYTNENEQPGDPRFTTFAYYGAYILKNKNLPAGNYIFDNVGKITSVQLSNSGETITYQYKCY